MRASPDHYERAVAEAVEDMQPYLRGPYETATRKYSNDSEAILWAVADTHELTRQAREISKSYERIMASIPGSEARYFPSLTRLVEGKAG